MCTLVIHVCHSCLIRLYVWSTILVPSHIIPHFIFHYFIILSSLFHFQFHFIFHFWKSIESKQWKEPCLLASESGFVSSVWIYTTYLWFMHLFSACSLFRYSMSKLIQGDILTVINPVMLTTPSLPLTSRTATGRESQSGQSRNSYQGQRMMKLWHLASRLYRQRLESQNDETLAPCR